MTDHTLVIAACGYILGRELIDVVRVVLRWKKGRDLAANRPAKS